MEFVAEICRQSTQTDWSAIELCYGFLMWHCVAAEKTLFTVVAAVAITCQIETNETLRNMEYGYYGMEINEQIETNASTNVRSFQIQIFLNISRWMYILFIYFYN